MTLKERREREKAEMRELILDAANEIIKAEGMDKLSIRKIANKIEYAPSIIYHYFHDKDEIVGVLMQKGYKKIMDALSSSRGAPGNPVQKITGMLRNYIYMALQIPDEYLSIMLSGSTITLEHTSVLFKGASHKRPAVSMFCEALKEISQDMDEGTIELSAQVIWAATFGLIIRLLIEKDIGEEQKNKLIERQIEFVIDGVLNGKPLNEL